MTQPFCFRRSLAPSLTLLLLAVACKEPPPVEAPSTAPSKVAQLSEEAMRRNGIRLAKAERHSIVDTIEAPAELVLNPDRVAHVSSLVAGQLLEVEVSMGAHVEAGQSLAVLRSVELGQARAENQRAQAMLEIAQANYIRQQRLRSEGIASEKSFLEAKFQKAKAQAERDAAQAMLQVFGLRGGRGPTLTITAPLAGTVIARHATRGENVAPGDDLFVIADTAKVWAVGHVYEGDMAKVRVGAKAQLSLQSQPDRSREGSISFVAPVVEEATRTLAVRVELDNEDGSLRPGLFGRLQISVGEPEALVAVPLLAVQSLRGESVVFVPAASPHSFRPQPVSLGWRNTALVEIREGLEPGAPFVVDGAFLLKSQLLASEFGEEE